jgi:hypothetical protein
LIDRRTGVNLAPALRAGVLAHGAIGLRGVELEVMIRISRRRTSAPERA